MVYFDYVKLLFKSAMQYRASLFMLMIGQFIATFGYFFVLIILFERFGSLAGWSFAEAALCFGASGMAFYLACMFARGFDVFQRYIRNGDFDRFLLRPRSLVLQVFGMEVNFSSFGRICQGMVILLYAVSLFDNWTWLKSIGLALMVICGFVVFSGVFMLGATVCFWTVQGLEFTNIFTFGGREITSYPLTIFGRHLARFFTFVLPYACFNYLPLQYVAGRTDNPAYLLFPIAGMLFIFPCLLVWRFGVGHYASTGS